MVRATLSMVLMGASSSASFSTAAGGAFIKTLLIVAPHLTRAAQITALNVYALSVHGNDDDGGLSMLQKKRALADGSSVRVSFALSLDVREVSAVTGIAYAISGPAGAYDWATSNSTLGEAARLASDVAATVQNATTTISDLTYVSGLSVWDATAQGVLAALPSARRSEGFTLAASPTAGVVVEAGSVKVVVCSWDEPCEVPTPVPTSPLPSQVPTPVPSPQPEYTQRSLVSAHLQ